MNNDFDKLKLNSIASPIDVKAARMNPYGETPVDQAPEIVLQKKRVIPQQFLNFHRDLHTIEAVLNDIEFSDKYILFVNSLENLFCIQVGMIGRENYPPSKVSRPDKIVYGRKWLIDEDMPTSEIVQTAFLAIKKSREHELREYFVLQLFDEQGVYQGKCTPFNSHIDLPLLVDNQHYVSQHETQWHANNASSSIQELLDKVSLAEYEFQLSAVQSRTRVSKTSDIELAYTGGVEQWLIDIELVDSSTACDKSKTINAYFPELKNAMVTIVVNQLNTSSILYALMDAMLQVSDEYVAETFSFKGFTRFSRSNNAQAIGAFSRQSRVFDTEQFSANFQSQFAQMTYDVDSKRAPKMAHSALGEKQKRKLESHQQLEGFLPTNDKPMCAHE